MRRHFVRRVLIGVGGFFLLTFALSAILVATVTRAFDVGGGPEFFIPAALLGFALVIVVALIIRRAVRWTAGPIGEVMEGAASVAEGDYNARVEVRGPRDVRGLAQAFNTMVERLQENEAQRRNLLADIAHELRGPLMVIRGRSEAIMDGLYAPDDEHLRQIVEEAKVMTRLLDDLQTLSRAEAGVLRLHRESVAPAAIVEDLIGALEVQARNAGVLLTGRTDEQCPQINVDPMRVRQVLQNVVGNSLRYTPRGGRIEVSAEPAADGVAFAVADTGSGVSAEQLPHLFERFTKSADSGGAGLGLAIAKSIVEAHRGSITAESKPGKTTVRFVLPTD